MERNIIIVNESGSIIMPENIASIWMSEAELVELFGVIAPTLRAAIRAIYKSGALKEYEVQKYIRLENGYNADVFSFTMIVALSALTVSERSRCAMPYLKGCTCEKRKQVSSFRWAVTERKCLIIRHKIYKYDDMK